MSARTDVTWVLIRGLTREQGHWGGFTQTLAHALPGARLVCVDLPGAGDLHRQRCPLRMAAIVQACRVQLQAAGLPPPYGVLGLSMGGMVAAEWARLWPRELHHIVLINTSMRPFGAPRQRLRPSVVLPLLRILFNVEPMRAEARILGLTSSRPETHQAMLPAWLQLRRERPVSRANAGRQLLAAAIYRWRGQAPTVPLLVLCSDGDRLVEPDCSRRMARAFAAPLAVHADAGHDLVLDDGAWVAAQVAAWLDGP